MAFVSVSLYICEMDVIIHITTYRAVVRVQQKVPPPATEPTIGNNSNSSQEKIKMHVQIIIISRT